MSDGQLVITGAAVSTEKGRKQSHRLMALDMFGNCQRPAFSLGVFQHIHVCIK